MQTIRLIGRGSRLSLLQLEKVKQRIEAVVPGIEVQVIARSSRGDHLQDIPLHTVEGTDFFTGDIFEALANNEADIAVHSLKDMSAEHFFGANRFAVVDRDDTRDVAIFNAAVTEKLSRGATIVIGTCSPRREEMAISFLRAALPRLSTQLNVTTKDIRGNVDTRLRKLDAGEYDGIILATAGLNRLLDSPADALSVSQLLQGKKLMLLPLIECVPAPCQGAIVAEAHPSNTSALKVLEQINIPGLLGACVEEKKLAAIYGKGCMQRFGVTSIRFGEKQTVYASGIDSKGAAFSTWTGLPQFNSGYKLFNAADSMGSFFHYDYNVETPAIEEPVVYIANYKAVAQDELVMQLKNKRVWASGTKTWKVLAGKGIWVEGCADAFGLEFLEQPWQMPLLGIGKDIVAVVTNGTTAGAWREKGWKVYVTYSTRQRHSADIEQQVREADILFWTSYRQFEQYHSQVKQGAVHSCPYGETAAQLSAAGVDPVIFPNIKAFQQWRQTSGL